MDTVVLLKNVSKVYELGKTKVEALKNVNMEIKKGEFISISGPSGSGKTTILNIIGCLDTPTTGEVYIDGINTRDFTDDEQSILRNEKIGYIFQSFNLIPVLNVYENIEFPLILPSHPGPKHVRKARIMELIESVGLCDYIRQRPNQLSGGQQQRVAIARSLVTQPKLVLADEPSANLDSENSKNIMEIMKGLNEKKGTTFVFSTHDPLVIGYAKRNVKLKDGQIVVG
jgi:putative ABC transport system ATP-binding protein